MKFNPLEYPICLDTPRWLRMPIWQPHIPFAMFLVAALQPKAFVELGVSHGDSYCSFCQAVKTLRIDSRCHAIDTWQGDPQNGFYGPQVLVDLRAHHDPLYGEFSTLIQKTFDEAAAGFEDGSIDLLHIDGYHTYEAVKHDFETWLPRLSRRGVVLLHDIAVRMDDFGVWRLWDEIRPCYPCFAFYHACGLGVVAVGQEVPEAIRFLFEANPTEADALRRYFEAVGERILTVELNRRAAAMAIELKRWDQAASHLQHILATQPESEDIPPVLAECFIAAGRLEEGRAVLSAALAAHPEQVPLRLRLTDLLIAAGKPQAAMEALLPALKQEPRQPVVYQKLGSILTALGRHEDAAGMSRLAKQLGS